MVQLVKFISTTNPREVISAPPEDIISIEDLDEVTLIELMTESMEIVLIEDNKEVLGKLAPKLSGIGRPTNYEEFQKGVYLAKEVYFNFLSLFINPEVEDGFASSLGLSTKYKKDVFYHDKFLERLISLSEQEPTDEAPYGPVVSYDLLIQHSEVLIREGKRLPEILKAFIADVLADTHRDKGEKKRPRPKHPDESAGRKRVYFIRDKALDIAILALVQEGWTEVGNESKIPDKKDEGKELDNPEQRYEDDAWADSAVFGVAAATGYSFGVVKTATTKYRRQRGT